MYHLRVLYLHDHLGAIHIHMYYHLRVMTLKAHEQEEKESIVSGTLDRCVCVCVCACVCAWGCVSCGVCVCVCARARACVTDRQIDR
jgi:hypothetical protein